MDTIKTYAVGNGEITLTKQDAEELRIILQNEYIESVINEIIDATPEYFCFPSAKVRARFVNTLVSQHDDMRDILGGYEENMTESIFHLARHMGLGVNI